MSWSWLELLRIAVLPHNERSRAKLLLFKVDAFTKLRCWSISDLLLGNYWGKLYNCSTFFLALFIACWINSVYDDPLSLSKRAFFSTTTLPFRSYLTSSQYLGLLKYLHMSDQEQNSLHECTGPTVFPKILLKFMLPFHFEKIFCRTMG